MAYNFFFKIESVDCHVEKNGLQNVIFNVHWRYFAQDPESEKQVDTCGMVQVSDPDPNSFTPVDQLYNSEVVSWIEQILDVNDLNRILTQRLDELVTPKEVSLRIKPDPVEDQSTESDSNVDPAGTEEVI